MRSRGFSSRLMALAGAWKDDLGPRRHMIADFMSEYVILHLMKDIAWLYGCPYLLEISPASLRNATVADGPHPPLVERTNGVKVPCSTWLIRCSYFLLFSFSCLRWVEFVEVEVLEGANELKTLTSKKVLF